VFFPRTNGSSWSKAAAPAWRDTQVTALVVSGAAIFAGTQQAGCFFLRTTGVVGERQYRSGQTRGSTPLPRAAALFSQVPRAGCFFPEQRSVMGRGRRCQSAGCAGLCACHMRQHFFAGIHAGVLLSTNNGASWAAAADVGLVNTHVNPLPYATALFLQARLLQDVSSKELRGVMGRSHGVDPYSWTRMSPPCGERRHYPWGGDVGCFKCNADGGAWTRSAISREKSPALP